MSSPPSSPPPTRWAALDAAQRSRYADRFTAFHEAGTDLDGEARLIDAMAGRESTILDAGCGLGRVASALADRGHRVLGVDADADLLALGHAQHPGIDLLHRDLLELRTEELVAAGHPGAFDLIVCAGNVMVFLAPGTEARAVAALAALLVPGGRLVCGFALDRGYPPDQLDADASAAGLVPEQRFASWHLDPWSPESDWLVAVHRRRGGEPDHTPSIPAR